MTVNDIQNIPSNRYLFEKENHVHFPYLTLQHGFYFGTRYWIYSRIDKEGVGKPILYDGLQWISDEEEEELENNCIFCSIFSFIGTPGDIRVGFEYKECPHVMTVVGVQNDDLIMPVRRLSGTFSIGIPMNATAEELLSVLDYDQAQECYTLRFICGCGVFIGMLVMYGSFIPFRVKYTQNLVSHSMSLMLFEVLLLPC